MAQEAHHLNAGWTDVAIKFDVNDAPFCCGEDQFSVLFQCRSHGREDVAISTVGAQDRQTDLLHLAFFHDADQRCHNTVELTWRIGGHAAQFRVCHLDRGTRQDLLQAARLWRSEPRTDVSRCGEQNARQR